MSALEQLAFEIERARTLLTDPIGPPRDDYTPAELAGHQLGQLQNQLERLADASAEVLVVVQQLCCGEGGEPR